MVSVPINADSRARLSLNGLTQRHLPRWLGLIAIGLALPGIFQGWAADDLIHRVILLHQDLGGVLRNLFVFASPPVNGALHNAGALPWWTVPDLTVAFFRPVAAVSHWLDYRLFPNTATLMHLHSALWYGLVCWLAALVYRQVLGRTWVAGLAGLLFIVDIGHLGLVAWLANRNALIAMALGLYVLYVHIRWRTASGLDGASTTRRQAVPWMALLGFACALLASEAAVAVLAYVVAHELLLARHDRARGGLALALYIAVAGAWWIGYGALGYGLVGTGFYADPGSNPLRYLVTVMERGPLLLAAQWLGLAPVLVGYLSDGATRVAWGSALAILAAGAIILLPLVRTDRIARFWLLGMLLALVPACTTRLLGSRQLLFVSLGALALIAQIVEQAVNRSAASKTWRSRISATSVVAVLLLLLHLLAPLPLLPMTASASDSLQDVVEHVLPLTGTPATSQTERVFVINAPSPFHFLYWPAMTSLTADAQLAQPRVLAPGYTTVTLTRVDAQTILVRAQQGFYPGADNGPRPAPVQSARMDEAYLYEEVASFFRDVNHPMAQGDEVVLDAATMDDSVDDSVDVTVEVTVEVVELTQDARPLAARMVFAHALEDETYAWLQWDWEQGVYVEFTPPPIGATIELPGPL